MDDATSAGLKNVQDGVAVGHGYLQLDAGAGKGGAFAEAEAGFKAFDHVDLFASAELTHESGAKASVGVKWSF